jgi:hypothetical protein
VCAQLPHWHFAHVNGVLTDLPGLVVRRTKEVKLYQTLC